MSHHTDWKKRGTWSGAICGAIFFHHQHAVLEMEPEAAVILGLLVGTVPGAIIGWFVANENGQVSTLFAAIGGLSGGFLGLATAAHAEAEWWGVALTVWFGAVFGAKVGEKLWIILAILAALVIVFAPRVAVRM